MKQPHELFPERSDAIWLLAGIGGFWSGWTLAVVLGLLGGGQASSPFILAAVVLAFGGAIAHQVALRRLQMNLTGTKPKPWPFGYPSFGTQIQGTFPNMMVAAARRLGLNGPLVAGALYAILTVGVVAFVILITTTKPTRH